MRLSATGNAQGLRAQRADGTYQCPLCHKPQTGRNLRDFAANYVVQQSLTALFGDEALGVPDHVSDMPAPEQQERSSNDADAQSDDDDEADSDSDSDSGELDDEDDEDDLPAIIDFSRAVGLDGMIPANPLPWVRIHQHRCSVVMHFGGPCAYVRQTMT